VPGRECELDESHPLGVAVESVGLEVQRQLRAGAQLRIEGRPGLRAVDECDVWR
jgi:hypothetical protein